MQTIAKLLTQVNLCYDEHETNMMKQKVSLFVGGVQKAGTRSITNYFRINKQLSVHKSKEGHFFDISDNFINDAAMKHQLNKYHESYIISDQTKILCDISPDYLFRHGAIERIYKYNSNAIWLIFLRNPIQRAYSAWNMEVNRKTENFSFEEALRSELEGNPKSRSHDRYQYIGRSRYYNQLVNLWKYFPKSQCLIYPAEEVWEDPQKVLTEILHSLNIKPENSYIYEHIHKGEYANKISRKAHEILVNQLYFELTELPSILKWSYNPWIETLDYAAL